MSLTKRFIKEEISDLYWGLGAVYINFDEPFRIGKNRSPIYLDTRLFFGNGNARNTVRNCLEEYIDTIENRFDGFALCARAGLALGSSLLVRDEMSKKKYWTYPAVYLSKNLRTGEYVIEGLKENKINNKKFLLVDELIASGNTKLNFIEKIREKKGKIEDCVVICDVEQGGEESLKYMGVKLHSFVTLRQVLDLGLKIKKDIEYYPNRESTKEKKFTEKEYDQVLGFLSDVKGWHLKNGFEYF